MVQCVISSLMSEEVTALQKLRSVKKKATWEINLLIYAKNWAAIGGSTLQFIRWYHSIHQKSSGKQFNNSTAPGTAQVGFPLMAPDPLILDFYSAKL